MKLEVLVSTMRRSDMSFLENMNVKSDALAVNQCDLERTEENVKADGSVHKMISVRARGLSKSRNLAISNSKADICAIADDDLFYVDDYPEIIKNAHMKYPDSDIIAFSVPSENTERPTSELKSGRVGFISSMKLSSFQLTFKRKSITDKNIKFNELFGAGARFTCGEENIWLSDCLKKGLKIRFESRKIASVNHGTSTWFKGFNQEYLKTKGAMFYAMRKSLWLPLVLQYAVRKHRLYRKNLSFWQAVRLMRQGRSEYAEIKKEKSVEQLADT